MAGKLLDTTVLIDLIPDALIAATALLESLELMSDNVRHFNMIPDLVITRPY